MNLFEAEPIEDSLDTVSESPDGRRSASGKSGPTAMARQRRCDHVMMSLEMSQNR
jgi:hypothetical protein